MYSLRRVDSAVPDHLVGVYKFLSTGLGRLPLDLARYSLRNRYGFAADSLPGVAFFDNESMTTLSK
jgi:hypothetical protein